MLTWQATKEATGQNETATQCATREALRNSNSATHSLCRHTSSSDEQRRWKKRSGSRPPSVLTNTSRITFQDWMTQPMETLVEHRLLDMTLKQLELRCTNNTVHYVLNQDHAKDPLLTSNDLKRVLSKTPKFRPTPNILKPGTVAKDCNLFGHRLIKTFNRFVCKDFINMAKINSKTAGISSWKPKQFPLDSDFYAKYNQDYFDTSKGSGYIWRKHYAKSPGLEDFIKNFKKDTMLKTANLSRL